MTPSPAIRTSLPRSAAICTPIRSWAWKSTAHRTWWQSARREPAHFQDREHDLGSQVKAGRELVGVPANQFIACVGVKGAKRAGGGSDFAFMLHRVSG